MARNKYPEETVKKILDVSYRLFREKGYDHTTIQDITDALGMSKGAIYHHFKSKEDILDRISDRYYAQIEWFGDIRKTPGKNGLEKLQNLLSYLLSDPRKHDLDEITISLIHDPKLILLTLESTISDAAPCMEALIREGVADGSISVRHPKEFAETFMLLMNIWVGMFTGSREDFLVKLDFLKEFTDKLGLPLMDEQFVQTCTEYYDRILSNQATAGI